MGKKEFNQINVALPKKNSGGLALYSVDRYDNLKSLQKEVERDHIPSYAAVEYFMKNRGFDIVKGSKKRLYTLNNNLTAVSVSYNSHLDGRTHNDKNKTLSKIDGENGLSLRYATLKDFATIAFVEGSVLVELLRAFTIV